MFRLKYFTPIFQKQKLTKLKCISASVSVNVIFTHRGGHILQL